MIWGLVLLSLVGTVIGDSCNNFQDCTECVKAVGCVFTIKNHKDFSGSCIYKKNIDFTKVVLTFCNARACARLRRLKGLNIIIAYC
jgi:hypothetical protein